MCAKAAPATAKPMSKTEVITALAEQTGLTKKDVSGVMDALVGVIGQSLGKKGPGVFNLHGLAKFKKKHKPATKARKGINPLTKEEMVFKAKPASNVVKIVPLKALKDLV